MDHRIQSEREAPHQPVTCAAVSGDVNDEDDENKKKKELYNDNNTNNNSNNSQ